MQEDDKALFSQEERDQAIALFRLAGDHHLFFGVCKICPLAQSILQQAVAMKATQLRESATDWVTVIDSLIADYQCR